jgi:glycosyltransferase involved in cell wall biosynthesis
MGRPISSVLENETAPASVKRKCLHLITCEFPPQAGGVSDYSYLVAEQLSHGETEVHVWCPRAQREAASSPSTVHRSLGSFYPVDLWRAGRQLNSFPGPRHLLVQWVPHGYGLKAANIPFAAWLWLRAAWHRDRVDVMVHEAYVDFHRQWKRFCAAAAQRIMMLLVMRAAQRVWLAIPALEARVRPYAVGRNLTFRWLPVPSNIPVAAQPARAARLRQQYLGRCEFLVGHFGTYGQSITGILEPALLAVLQNHDTAVLLMGRGSIEFRQKLVGRLGGDGDRVHAAGPLEASDLSPHLDACDVMLQPYPDGITTRRGTAMAALAHGRPIVTTLGIMSENFWQSSGAIAAVPAGNSSALAEAVSVLLSDARARQLVGARARRLYQDRFDVRHTVAALSTAG